MSLFNPTDLNCPSCDRSFSFELCASVNADRRPDLRQAILDETFQRATCPHCQGTVRMEPRLSYLDVGRGQWMAAFPRNKVDDWKALEASALDSFNRAFGAGASAAERELGDALKARVVFSWEALREKLLAFDAGLDDVALEELKLLLLRDMQEPPLPLGAELRLTGVASDTGDLDFTVLDRQGQSLESLTVPRDLLAEVTGDPEGWAELTRSLQAGPFVDVQRLSRGQ
ncbi:CpXC domain-containing protein [Hyalangium rubrum]|uniref:CpXC domain-containing protein n=1 Tax=Hyalangium rubrum TaxID=3103134 RepID=A0ABU5HH25_9BACT|nr:CpXC domain-containing protein [Hyalangium sp. s54d21]MDY7232449.1 CpXC domain-containing protein [Hyalangium sp. s54d21]